MRVMNDTHLNQMTIIRHEGKLGHTEHMGKETQNRSLRCDKGLRLEGICGATGHAHINTA